MLNYNITVQNLVLQYCSKQQTKHRVSQTVFSDQSPAMASNQLLTESSRLVCSRRADKSALSVKSASATSVVDEFSG